MPSSDVKCLREDEEEKIEFKFCFWAFLLWPYKSHLSQSIYFGYFFGGKQFWVLFLRLLSIQISVSHGRQEMKGKHGSVLYIFYLISLQAVVFKKENLRGFL